MGGGLSALATQSSTDYDLPVTDPDKCQHKFCEKWGPGHYHCADCHSTIQDETLIASEDAIIDSIVDESVAEDGVYRGVSIQFLVDFATTCKCWDMTTRDVRRRFVMPATRSSRCRFVELPEMQQSPQKYVGRAGTFVSHTWGARFGDLVAALCDGGADRSRYVWVDIFAVRQWPSRKPDLDFSAVVRQCGSFVVVCSSLPEVASVVRNDTFRAVRLPPEVRNQIAFLRVWCLVEVHSAILSGGAMVIKGGSCTFCVSTDLPQFNADREMLGAMTFMVDIESADATVASDKERILNEIRASEGGVDAVNRAVRGALVGSALADPLVQCAACDDQNAMEEVLKEPSKHIVATAGSGYVKILQKLINKGADVNRMMEGINFTPLAAAVNGGHLECLLLLLKCNSALGNKPKLVCLAAMYGHTAVVSALLDHGCELNASYHKYTPLMISCMHGHPECAKLLLDRGADVNMVDREGLTALGIAVQCNHPLIFQMLLDYGVDATSELHSSALPAAAGSGNIGFIEILIKLGCNLEAKRMSETALMAAVVNDKLTCLHYLINAGCNLEAVDSQGRTALCHAAIKGVPQCMEALITAGCRLDAVDDRRKMTALHHAASNGHLRCVEILINAACPLEAKDNSEKSALYHAKSRGHADCVEVLVGAGCQPDEAENDGLIDDEIAELFGLLAN